MYSINNNYNMQVIFHLISKDQLATIEMNSMIVSTFQFCNFPILFLCVQLLTYTESTFITICVLTNNTILLY